MTSVEGLAALSLLLVRPGMLVIATPLFGGGYAPTTLRIGLIVIVAVLLAPIVPVPGSDTAVGLAGLVAREAAVGLALAFAIRVLVAGAELAGHFSSYQLGLSIGSLIDPQSGVRNNVLAILYANLVVVVCLMTQAHHAVLRALVDSYTALPIGAGGLDGPLASTVAHLLGLVFLFGVRLAMPVVVALLIVELGLGLLARTAPSLNVLMSGAPIRLVVGLLVIAATIAAVPSLVGRFFPAALQTAVDASRAFR
jgi:flagellar biosynthetic protein FliR